MSVAIDTIVFEKQLAEIGRFSIRPLEPEKDAVILTDWVNRDYAYYWGMKNTSEKQVRKFYCDLESLHPGSIFIGLHQQRPVFLLECYQAQNDIIGQYYPVLPDDYGMHILVSPPSVQIRNFTWGIFQIILEFIFSDPKVGRIVVEPDIHNEKIHRLNKRAGFVYQQKLQLPNKIAWLAFCLREQYQRALEQGKIL